MTNMPVVLQGDKLLISGEMTFATIISLQNASQKLLLQQPTWKFDLSQVTTCDSAGLALLLEWIKKSKQEKKSIQFLNLPQQLKSIAAAADLEKLIFGRAN